MSRRLLHFVSLGGPGGVERHFIEFVRHAMRHGDPPWNHAALIAGGRIHGSLESEIDASLIAGCEKYAGPIKLPKWPRGLRRAALRRAFDRARPDVVLIWNRPVRSRTLFAAVAPATWLHWEHGAAWHSESELPKRDFYRRCPWVIANSMATRRVLALRWGRSERVDVCPNALHPRLSPTSISAKKLHTGPLRLGMAGRGVSIKGSALALHALAVLRGRGIDARLHAAGDGAHWDALRALARRLGIASSVVWQGHVDDMGGFYRDIDCFVHPALHESFGLVCLEAAAHGCPVVTTAVDGLPEVVNHEVTGFCIEPRLPLSDYAALGGSLEDIPAFIYDPSSDDLAAPKVVSPEALADAIERLLEPGVFAEFSAAAVELGQRRSGFDAHVDAVMTVVARLYDENS